MIKVQEHSIEESLLDNGYVIDAGCGVDFNFSTYMADRGMQVIGIDPNPAITVSPPGVFFENKALVAFKRDMKFTTFHDIDAATLLHNAKDVINPSGQCDVELITLPEIFDKYRITQLEVLKLDVEGSEYEILDNIDGPIAKQISVEFHDFRNFNPHYPNNERYYSELFKKLSQWYVIAKHTIEEHGGMPTHLRMNYWDSLFILK